jgi:Tfp pilus assembly protein PilN
MAIRSEPLLIEWSPVRARVLDQSTGKLTEGASIAECLQGPCDGREAIIAVSQRSAFVRSLFVPRASRAESASVIRFQLGSILPLNPSECVVGFRLGAEQPGLGRIAVVGALKTDSLRKIYAEAKLGGITVRAVVPLAFGSWLAARELGLVDCAVVRSDDKTLAIDLVEDGELRYSRSIPRPPADDLQDEIARTFSIAGLRPAPIVTNSPGLTSDRTFEKETLEYLGDLHVIDSQLFSFELPEIEQGRTARRERWRVQRAVAAALAAVVLGGLAFMAQNPPAPKSNADAASASAALKKANTRLTAAKTRLAGAEKAKRILDAAFDPGQSLGDIVTVLSGSASKNSWFTDLTIGRGIPLNISGLALSDRDVSDFVAQLSHDPRFQDMRAASIQKSSIGKRPVTQFRITGTPMGLMAFNHTPRGARKGT